MSQRDLARIAGVSNTMIASIERGRGSRGNTPVRPSPETLRHSFAGIALEGGAELIDVSRALGHANSAITDRVYAGRLVRGAKRAVEVVAKTEGWE